MSLQNPKKEGKVWKKWAKIVILGSRGPKFKFFIPKIGLGALKSSWGLISDHLDFVTSLNHSYYPRYKVVKQSCKVMLDIFPYIFDKNATTKK